MFYSTEALGPSHRGVQSSCMSAHTRAALEPQTANYRAEVSYHAHTSPQPFYYIRNVIVFGRKYFAFIKNQ